jgi:hypothetical protein
MSEKYPDKESPSFQGIDRENFKNAIRESSERYLAEDIQEGEKDFAKQEEKAYELEFAKNRRVDERHNTIKRLVEREAEQRRKLVGKFFTLFIVWLVFIAFVVLYEGWQGRGCFMEKRPCFEFGENIVLGLIGATTLTISSFLLVVAKYFFRASGKKLETLMVENEI